jgi:hypothetical protein
MGTPRTINNFEIYELSICSCCKPIHDSLVIEVTDVPASDEVV